MNSKPFFNRSEIISDLKKKKKKKINKTKKKKKEKMSTVIFWWQAEMMTMNVAKDQEF